MSAHNEQQPNEAVSWTVVGPDGKSSIGGWRDMGTLEFWKKMAVLREGHRYAYAAPVTAAPGIDIEHFHRAVQRICIKFDGDLPYISGIAEVLDMIDASPKGATFPNDGNSEAQFVADGERLNCPACGGSGHVEDSPKGGSEARDAELKAAQDAGHTGAIRWVLGHLNGHGECGGTYYEEILNWCGREQIIQSAIDNDELEFTGLADFIKKYGTPAEKRKVRARRHSNAQAGAAEVQP